MTAKWLAIILIGSASFMPSCSASADDAPRAHYDPSLCKGDAHDQFYIALGRNVLAVPYRGTAMTGPIYPGMKLTKLVPPDPTEPEGCPGNPLQLQSYAFVYYLDAIAARKAGITPKVRPSPDLLQLIRVETDETSSGKPGHDWMGEGYQLDLSDRRCKTAAVHETLPNGMAACRVKASDTNVVADWAASYVAAPDLYTAPMGEKFVVNCGPGLFTDSISHCEVSYVIVPEIGVFYRFQPYRGPHAIPIDSIIDFDRRLRASIEASLVKDYPWPGQ